MQICARIFRPVAGAARVERFQSACSPLPWPRLEMLLRYSAFCCRSFLCFFCRASHFFFAFSFHTSIIHFTYSICLFYFLPVSNSPHMPCSLGSFFSYPSISNFHTSELTQWKPKTEDSSGTSQLQSILRGFDISAKF